MSDYLSVRLQEGIVNAFLNTPFPEDDSIALDLGSFIEPERVNDSLIALKEALDELNKSNTAYYTIANVEIVMETG